MDDRRRHDDRQQGSVSGGSATRRRRLCALPLPDFLKKEAAPATARTQLPVPRPDWRRRSGGQAVPGGHSSRQFGSEKDAWGRGIPGAGWRWSWSWSHEWCGFGVPRRWPARTLGTTGVQHVRPPATHVLGLGPFTPLIKLVQLAVVDSTHPILLPFPFKFL
jgi:hypothetical protein